MNKTTPALSYWEKEAWLKDLDVVVIGAGIVGLNAAWELKQQQPGLRVLVVERGSLPAGASTRNAGFACFGSLSELLSDQQVMGMTATLDLVAQRYAGLRRMREKLGDEHIDYREWGGYEIFRPAESELFDKCMTAATNFNTSLAAMTQMSTTYSDESQAIDSLGFRGVRHLILNRAEGQIHTGKMMQRLLHLVQQAGVGLLYGTDILGLEEQESEVYLQTQQGWDIRARRIIVATNGFVRRLLPELAVQPARNQILITKPISGLNIRGCFHYDQGYYYFRNIDQRILLGGGRHLAPEAETTDQFGFHPEISQHLVQLLRGLILPDTKIDIDHWWSGIMGVGAEKKPIIRHYSPRVTLAVRMGGMGVAIGSWVGEEAARQCLAGDTAGNVTG